MHHVWIWLKFVLWWPFMLKTAPDLQSQWGNLKQWHHNQTTVRIEPWPASLWPIRPWIRLCGNVNNGNEVIISIFDFVLTVITCVKRAHTHTHTYTHAYLHMCTYLCPYTVDINWEKHIWRMSFTDKHSCVSQEAKQTESLYTRSCVP